MITAAWNALDGLKQTVASVAGQTCRDVEHVIADGGSTDGTQAWLESLGGNVRWISEPDEGIADALNKAVAMARGQYVLVLQAEDSFADKDSLARALPYLQNGDDIVSFDILFAEHSRDRRHRTRGLPFSSQFFNTIPHQGVLCRRDLFLRLGPFDTSFRIAMDYDFFLRARAAGASVKVVPEVLSRMPATGVSSQTDWPSLYRRFAEFRRAQRNNADSAAMHAVYAVFWPLYLTYRRARAMMSPAR